MKKVIEIKKGDSASRLLLVRDLTEGLQHLFEDVDNPKATESEKWFGAGKMRVASKSFKATLIIEEV